MSPQTTMSDVKALVAALRHAGATAEFGNQ